MGALEIPAYSIAEECRSKIVNLTTAVNGKAAANHTHSYAATSHTHDDRYYTETEVNNLLAAKAAATDVTALKYYLTQSYVTAQDTSGLNRISSGGAFFTRIGKLVICEVSIQFINKTSNVDISFGTARAELRPSAEKLLILTSLGLAQAGTALFRIKTNGALVLEASSAAARINSDVFYQGISCYYAAA